MKCHIFKNIGKIILLTSLIFPNLSPAKANNIRITGKPQVVSFIGNDTAIVELNLSWDNSWRDDFNWDAAWIFIKYKKRGALAPWHHAYLTQEGHEATPLNGNEGGDHTFMFGKTGSGTNAKVTGVYLMRDAISEGKVYARLRLKWIINANPQNPLTIADFGDDLKSIYVAVHGIEMVYIPYGSYYLGDAYSDKSFAVGDTAAVFIDSENALTLSAKDGMPNVSLAASYPKGYAGFYVMKYETSQEQYVEFLNSLTLEQQKARVANNNFVTMKRGDYVFGDIAQPSCRNGIVFIEQRKANTPVVFGNNLNPNNDLFSTDDGQTLACNYMSIEDMIAYCSWSGLRPMSELEYEKACRRFYPQVPDKGEYAWNTNNGVNRLNGLGDLNYRGDEREQALSYLKNVNSGTTNSINGPVRCGLFATSATNQTQAGATYWAVMEMSGNLKELCANVNYTAFNGGSCGTGVYNANLWDKTATKYGVRGGGFNSADDLLRTSDRTEAMNYFTTITQRDSTVGFRGVYSLSGIEINGGEISAPNTGCWGGTNITNVQDAFCPDFPNVRFQYTWYVKKPGEAKFDLLANATNETLKGYVLENNTTSTLTYQFKRVGISSLGVAESNILTVKILPKPFAKPDYSFNAGSSVSVTQYWGTNTSAQWQLEGAPSWAYVHSKSSNSLTIAGGLVNEEFTLKAHITQCPSDVFSATIKISNLIPYTGHMDSIKLAAGTYKMECWGAQGGTGYANYNSNGSSYGYSYGGNGGYTQGTVEQNTVTTYYVYVGGQGGYSTSKTGGSGGWNGGGSGGGDEGDDCGGGGGGATDIRIEGKALSNRIMVAGGGGGGSGKTGTGGTGGGNSGGYGRSGNSSTATTPGTQTSGYTLGSGGSGSYGGNNYCGGGGGGGGYHGGYGSAKGRGDNTAGGGGGSGYVNTNIFQNSSTSNGAKTGHGQIKITQIK